MQNMVWLEKERNNVSVEEKDLHWSVEGGLATGSGDPAAGEIPAGRGEGAPAPVRFVA